MESKDLPEEKKYNIINNNLNELVITNSSGIIVAKMNVKNSVLDGHCEWRNGEGQLVAYGTFRNGIPYVGTFLNWSVFFAQLRANPYGIDQYPKDWITLFEESFLSESPKYNMVLESYYNGEKILFQ
ncbi:MAG: hypothetical protein ABI861_00225 [Panacibacter sp.]